MKNTLDNLAQLQAKEGPRYVAYVKARDDAILRAVAKRGYDTDTPTMHDGQSVGGDQ